MMRKIEIQKLGKNYFAVNLPDGAEAGTHFTFSIEDQQIADEIKGTVKNNHLFRRWVMAQTFRGLHFNSPYYGKGYNGYVKSLGFRYQFDMMMDEVKALRAMEKDHDPEFEFRKRFFSIDTIKNVYRSLYGLSMETKKITDKIDLIILSDITTAKTYNDLYYAMVRFNARYRWIINWFNRHNGKQFTRWVDAFKGAGAYYTLENMLRFHGCVIKADRRYFVNDLRGETAVQILRKKIEIEKWEGYQIFALLKKVIKDNHFNFGNGTIWNIR